MKTYKSIDEYIRMQPKNVQVILQKIRKLIASQAPEAEEAIKYGMPTFTLNGNLVHFAAFQKHIGLYPTPGPIVTFKNELSKYESGKGSIQFPLDKPIPYDLIKKIVAYQVNQRTSKIPVRKAIIKSK